MVYALGVLSHYAAHVPSDYHIEIKSLVSRYKTVPLNAGDLSIDYGLEIFMFRNGLAASMFLPDHIPFWPFTNQKLSIKASFTDTRFSGDDLFANAYEEVALDIGTASQKGSAIWESLRVGFHYTFSDTLNGFSLNLGYTF